MSTSFWKKKVFFLKFSSSRSLMHTTVCHTFWFLADELFGVVAGIWIYTPQRELHWAVGTHTCSSISTVLQTKKGQTQNTVPKFCWRGRICLAGIKLNSTKWDHPLVMPPNYQKATISSSWVMCYKSFSPPAHHQPTRHLLLYFPISLMKFRQNLVKNKKSWNFLEQEAHKMGPPL